VTAFSETDLAKLTIEELHIAKASVYATQAQAPAMPALQTVRNEVLQARVQQAAARANPGTCRGRGCQSRDGDRVIPHHQFKFSIIPSATAKFS